MSHEIFGSRFLGVREPAWHRIGQVIEHDVTASEAVALAGLDYGVEKVELYLPDGIASGYSAIVRAATEDAEQEVFGVARDYELVHINEIVEQLDSLPWPITSAGALRGGKEIFVCYDLGDREMLGEAYTMNLAIAHPYAPGKAWRAMLTPTRVVCQNTLVFGERLATSKFSASHLPGAKGRIDNALVEASAAAMEHKALEALEALQKTKVRKKDVTNVIEITFPVPAMPRQITPAMLLQSEDEKAEEVLNYEKSVQYHTNIRKGAVETYNRFCDEHKDFAGTGYALYQSIVEWADWRESRSSEARIAEAALVGARANEKKRAFKAIMG